MPELTGEWKANNRMPGPRIDEIGPWSEIKLDILKRYAVEYSKILSSQKSPTFLHIYIDAFAINVLHHDPATVLPLHIERMNGYWGDDSWREVAYEKSDPDLFGNTDLEKVSNERVAAAFRERLRTVAGFKRVSKPLAMRNSKGSTVYYLFFASQKETAENIVKYIFEKFGTPST